MAGRAHSNIAYRIEYSDRDGKVHKETVRGLDPGEIVVKYNHRMKCFIHSIDKVIEITK
jgi:hypothetical protein